MSATARSEVQHIDDVDAPHTPQQDVLIQPCNRLTSPAHEPLSEAALYYIPPYSPTIQAHQNTFTNNTVGQDVHNSLSAHSPGPLHPSSPAYSRNGQQSESLSLPNTFHYGSLNDPSTRLRTTLPLSGTTLQLAAKHGIPTRLPPIPRVNSNNTNHNRPPVPRFNESAASTSTTPIANQYPTSAPDNSSFDHFQSVMADYIKMLHEKPEENGDASASAGPSSPAKAPAQLQPTPEEAAQNISNMLFGGVNDFTGPLWDEFLTSPFIDDNETPFESFLDTPAAPTMPDSFQSPLVADAGVHALEDPTFDDLPLMAQPGDFSKMSLETAPPPSSTASGSASPIKPPAPNFDGMYTMSPATPALEPSSAQNSPYIDDVSMSSPNPNTLGRKKKAPTGTRKNATPETLVPLEAPTQSRNYVTPSTTSRKAVPAVFARKRARSAAFGADEEDELAGSDGGSLEAPVNQAEAEAIATKRRQNTLAARRSRKRKLEYQRELEDTLESAKRERDMWKERAMMLRAQVMQFGLPDPFREV